MSACARTVRWTIVGAACALLLAAPGQAAAAASPQPVLHPLRSTDPAAVEAGRRRAALGAALASPMGPLQAPVAPKAVVSGSLNQPGLSTADNAARNNGTPPDPTGAVGPNHYVEFVNSVVGVYPKTDLSAVAGTAQLDTFVGATNHAVFDPQIQWDPQGDRWFYLADDCSTGACTATNELAYGFSKTADPSDLVNGWCRYSIRTDNRGGTGLFDDYPKLGHNDTQLIFGTNVFNLQGDFVSSRIWTVAKPSSAPIIGTCPAAAVPHYWSGPASAPVKDAPVLSSAALKAQDGSVIGTPVPADTTDSSANGYVVAAHDPVGTKIMAWHVDAGGSLVADGDITVSAFDLPALVPQPGTTDVLDSSDTRLTQAVAHADPDAGGAEAVWTQHTINGPGGRSVDRWYELLPATTTRRQEGNISEPGNFVFNGAISPAMAGNEAVIQYNVGGASTAAQVRAQSRSSGMPLGATTGEVTLASSANIDQDFSCPSNDASASSCRWGDYAGATPDPSNAHLVWGTNQLNGPAAGSQPRWTTGNFALISNAEPVASFTADPNPALRTKPVNFNAAGSNDPDGGGIATYGWQFGDGTSGTGVTPSHTYSQPGTYTVTLTVTDSDQGLSTSTTQQIVVQSAPTAAFTASPTPAFDGKPVSFDASASSDPDSGQPIASYGWQFGDGTSGTGAQPTHSYAQPGTYTVKLTVTDSDEGLSTSLSKPIVVQSSAPTAAFTVTPTTVGRGQSVSFDGSASADTEQPGGIASWGWDFDGNGTIDQTTPVPTTTHTYSAAGTFNVRLVVTDADDGLSSTAAVHPVTVSNAAPVARLTFAPASPQAGDTVSLSAADSTDDAGIASYHWDLDGNGTFETDTGTTPTAKKTFAKYGSFTVGLQVTDSDGATSTTTATIAVAPVPLKLVLTFSKKIKLAALLKSGLRGKVGCGHACSMKLAVTVPRRVARSLGIKTTIATSTIRLPNARSKAVKLLLGRKARAALVHANPKTLALSVGATATAATSKTTRQKGSVQVVR